MKGNNKLVLCESQMIEVVQHWLDYTTQRGTFGKVAGVKAKEAAFEVLLVEQEPEPDDE